MMRCAICREEINSIYEQNNPYPLIKREGKKVCHCCNDRYIIPYRILGMSAGRDVFNWLEGEPDNVRVEIFVTAIDEEED